MKGKPEEEEQEPPTEPTGLMARRSESWDLDYRQQ